MSDATRSREHHLSTARTARYHTMGEAKTARDVWIVLHGYGQLAEYFIRPFAALDDGTRLIVAPEGLSRFYLEGFDGRIGATWMTSADRLYEIDDYVCYLDALYERLVASGVPGEAGVHVLGFSQGAATACRWTAMGEHDVDRLILWAGGIPPDLDLEVHQPLFQRIGLTLVLGLDDEYISEERMAREEARLDRHEIPYRKIHFEGGHRIVSDVLEELVE